MSQAVLAPPDAVLWIVRTLEERGHETWTVGGAVRDAIRGRAGGDWDLATRATPKQVQKAFRRTVPIGVDHGTVGVLRDGTLYEVTTFRRDVETDGRHAVVAFADTIEEDLARRDFTVNAIAWHPIRTELLDPFDGVGDLRDGVLRTVGSANDRFREDYLRILRAFRFAGRFGLRIDDESWTSACSLVDALTKLSPERIREELLKVLGQDSEPGRALALYKESGALRVLYPELADRLESDEGDDWWKGRIATLARLPNGRPYLRLAALLRGVPREATAALLVRLRLSNQQTDRTARWAGAAHLPTVGAAESDVRRWLSRHGPEILTPATRIELAAARGQQRHEDAVRVVAAWKRSKTVLGTEPPLTVGALAIDGRDLKSCGLRPGPLFGEILDRLLEWVLDDPSRNTAEALLARVDEVAREVGADG